jgi:hypothetical protein
MLFSACCCLLLPAVHCKQQDLPSDDTGMERELDMDALNNATLWKLKAYVDGVLTATTGRCNMCFWVRSEHAV